MPPSKSYANRALVLGALAERPFTISNLPLASDVTNLLACLEVIGLEMERRDGGVRFVNSFPACEKKKNVRLNVGEGGTTARFLATMLLLGKSSYELILGERLKERPWEEFIDIVNKLGGRCQLDGDSLIVQGPVRFPEKIEIDCQRTTQFASAFQLLSITKPMRVIPLNLHASQSYWAMTERMLEEFRKNENYTIPLDWSSASYPLAFGALNQKIFFPGLRPDPFQADSKFFELLTRFDCLSLDQGGIKVRPINKDLSIDLDVSDCLDLVPTLGYFLSHIKGQHILRGIENLVYKESNRLKEVANLVRSFQRQAESDEHTFTIWGRRERIDGPKSLAFPDDHRLVMSGTLFLLHHGGGDVMPSEAIKKSYPTFFEIISSEI